MSKRPSMGERRDDQRISDGTAGASARREHERRRANREKRVHDKHPRIGGLILALGEPPRHERVWAQGASGEEYVAECLAKHLNDGARVLHDRRIIGSRTNIDHIVVAPSGVWVIDSKRGYKGKVVVTTPLLGSAKLIIAGRDRTKLVGGVEKQVGLVERAVRAIGPETPVRGALCFVDADLPVLGTLSLDGISLLHPKRLAKRINAKPTLSTQQVRKVATELTERFPAA